MNASTSLPGTARRRPWHALKRAAAALWLVLYAVTVAGAPVVDGMLDHGHSSAVVVSDATERTSGLGHAADDCGICQILQATRALRPEAPAAPVASLAATTSLVATAADARHATPSRGGIPSRAPPSQG